jgi:ABC-2 type transport system permease protein
MLATIAKSRAQLNGISTVVILVMSALGGSMVPRFAMPEFMNTTALFTFNGWALDGYLKVFWYGDPGASLLRSLLSLAPQLAVLGVMAIAFLAVSRFLAKRWETV